MADFSYADDLELQRLNEQVLAEPQEFQNWEKLVRAAEAQEGGLNRNSSPQAIAATRDTYDCFLARFPLFFGYWKKYADLEFAIAGTESAEMVYERGVASVGLSVDLWANYCAFKVETSHDADVIRELYERAADNVGLDFLAHPFWDKYLEFEERLDSPDRIFAILARVIHIPLHQYARYFEKFRGMAATRPIAQVVPEDLLAGFQEELGGDEKQRAPAELERELRARVETYLVGVFTSTQAETSQRWTFEQEIKRPYYHVTELDDEQLENWRRYLDFEEGKGEYARTKFLYERCLVTCANYEEFWFRYLRWTHAQTSITKEVRNEEVRFIYSRASCIFISIAQPTIRLYYARFEESIGRADTAIAIHEAILTNAPGDLETIVSLVNTHRRQYGVDAAIKVLKAQLNSGENSRSDRGALVVELARLHWRVKGDADQARSTFQKQQEHCDASPQYWTGYFDFELSQPTSLKEEAARHKRIKTLFDHIRSTSKLIKIDIDTFFEVSRRYLGHLLDRGDKDAMQEYIQLDRELNGPTSIRSLKIDAPKAAAANGS